MLKVAGLVKTYGPIRALDGVNFNVDGGAVVALLGPNGAGKTTKFRCILGVTEFEGHIEVCGLSVTQHGKEVRRRIGYLPQSPSLNEGDTCQQTLDFLADLRRADCRRIEPLLKLVNLQEQRHVRVASLSGGMRQRLALAAALLSDPPVLLLDEPTANLDVESRREFHDLIARLRDEGKTVVISTHFLDHLVALADRVVVLHQGHVIFDGTMEELASRAPGKRYLVNLNGVTPAAFIEALRAAGIGAENIRPADASWEDVLLELLPAGETENAGGDRP